MAGESGGVGPLKYCQLDQAWWCTQDWTGCVIDKRDGSGERKVKKKCEL